MREVVGDGMYPVGRNLCWHGGVHLEAPDDPNDVNLHLPVRAIADGVVLDRRIATERNPETENGPLAYEDWTSDGFVIIQHDTDIGAAANGTVVTVRYYSVYQHLTDIPVAIQPGQRVYRKAELGRAGYIAGQPHRIHFEIVCDPENLTRLIGRAQGQVSVDGNGREDVVFGEIYIRLPAGTSLYTVPQGRKLTDNNANAHTVSSVNPPGTPQALPSNATTPIDCYIGLSYAMGDGAAVAERGDLTVTTYREDGSVCGKRCVDRGADPAITPPDLVDAEYELYKRAMAISNAYPANGQPAASAIYELLRFGRVINTTNETLTPADVPQWRGWSIFDDDTSVNDSRCDSNGLKRLLDVNEDGHVTPEERRTRMQEETVRAKLRKVICSFPSEWNTGELQTRWQWLQTVTEENPEAMTADSFREFIAYAQALSFNLPAMATATMRFHPRGFIEAFRKCGWLSLTELAKTFPRHMFYTGAGNLRTAITTAGNTYTATLAVVSARIEPYAYSLNCCIRKYIGGHNKQRIALFLAQVLLETDRWRAPGLREYGYGAPNNNIPKAQYYTCFFGRGIMQLTWAGNYKAYGNYKRLADHVGAYVERRTGISPRLTATSTHYEWDPVVRQAGGGTTINHNLLMQWSPRYDPDSVGENRYLACDSGGFYWVSKALNNTACQALGIVNGVNINSINRLCDAVYSPTIVGYINVAVNGGGNGYYDRQAYSAFMLRFLTEDTDTSQTITVTTPPGRNNVTANMQVAG
jgi:hydroxyethylthiazole kinase